MCGRVPPQGLLNFRNAYMATKLTPAFTNQSMEVIIGLYVETTKSQYGHPLLSTKDTKRASCK